MQGLGGDQTALDGSGRKKLWGLLKKKGQKGEFNYKSQNFRTAILEKIY